MVDAQGQPVAEGETGELIIGGVGLARYLDPAKDAEKYAPMPSLGWERAYRSGDLVVNDAAGCSSAAEPTTRSSSAAGGSSSARSTGAAVLCRASSGPRQRSASTAAGTTARRLRRDRRHVRPDPGHGAAPAPMPPSLVPRLAVATPPHQHLRQDRSRRPAVAAAHRRRADAEARGLHGTWVARRALARHPRRGRLDPGRRLLRPRRRQPDLGTAGLAAPRPLPRGGGRRHLRASQPSAPWPPTSTSSRSPVRRSDRVVPPTPLKTQAAPGGGDDAAARPGRARGGWSGWGSARGCSGTGSGGPCSRRHRWWLLALGWLRLRDAAGPDAARGGRRPAPAPHRRGRRTTRVGARCTCDSGWLQRVVEELGATGLAGAPYMTWFARLLGAEVGRDVDLHSIPPVTGMLRLGAGCSIEPEVDLSGFWVDGDVVHLGPVRVGARARVGRAQQALPRRRRRQGRRGRPWVGGVRCGARRRVLVGLPGRPDPEAPPAGHGRTDRRPAVPGRRRTAPWPRSAVLPADRGGPGRGGAAGAACRRARRRTPTCSASSAWLPVVGTGRDAAPWPLLILVVVRAAGRRREAGRARRPQRRALAVVDDGAGARRRPELAVPALRLQL